MLFKSPKECLALNFMVFLGFILFSGVPGDIKPLLAASSCSWGLSAHLFCKLWLLAHCRAGSGEVLCGVGCEFPMRIDFVLASARYLSDIKILRAILSY